MYIIYHLLKTSFGIKLARLSRSEVFCAEHRDSFDLVPTQRNAEIAVPIEFLSISWVTAYMGIPHIWMVYNMEKSMKMDDLEVPLFLEAYNCGCSSGRRWT